MDILGKLLELIHQKGMCYKFSCDGCVFYSLTLGLPCELIRDYFIHLPFKQFKEEETDKTVKIKSDLRYKKAIELYRLLYGQEELMEILL